MPMLTLRNRGGLMVVFQKEDQHIKNKVQIVPPHKLPHKLPHKFTTQVQALMTAIAMKKFQ